MMHLCFGQGKGGARILVEKTKDEMQVRHLTRTPFLLSRLARIHSLHSCSRRDDILTKLQELCDGLASDMNEAGQLQAKTVTLKLKDKDFNVTTRAKSSAAYVHSSEDLFKLAHALLLPQLPITLRLMGVRASSFKAKPAMGKGALDAFLVCASSSSSSRSGGGAAAACSSSAGADVVGQPSGPTGTTTGKRRRGIEQFLTKQQHVGGVEEGEEREEGSDDEVEVISGPAAPAAPKARYTCPVCALAQPGLSLLEFNRHVDTCLAKSDPKFATQQQQQQQQGPSARSTGKQAKKHRERTAPKPLEHFFSGGQK